MKKLLSIALVLGVLGSGMVVKADTFVANTAKNQRGEEVRAEYGGYDSTRIAHALSDEVVCTGRCVLAGLIPSTGAAGALMYLFDTSVANVSATARLKMTSVFNPDATNVAATNRVPRPIRFTNGITVRLSSIGAGESVTVLYVDLDQR